MSERVHAIERPWGDEALRRRLAEVADRVEAAAEDAPDPVRGPVRDAVTPRGKLVRPAVTLLVQDVLSEEPDREAALDGAAGVELLHVATLVVDDAFDGAATRRGAASVAAAHGDRAAVLAAGVLTTQATRRLVRHRPAGGSGAVDRALEDLERLLAGEAAAHTRPSTVEAWRRVAERKTAALFEAAARVGAHAAGARPTPDWAVDYARSLGVAFQARDDLLDVHGDPDVIGKPTGADARAGAANLAHVAGFPRARAILEDEVARARGALSAVAESPGADALAGLAAWAASRRA